MPRAKSKSKTEDVDPNYVRMYYEHQYDRIRKHEEQALTISNIVLTISALIITFGLNNRKSFGSILVLYLPVVIVIVNLFAILYIRDSGRLISLYRMRAKHILETYTPELFVLDNETFALQKKRTVGRGRFQNLIHIIFIAIAIILILLFTLEALGFSIT